MVQIIKKLSLLSVLLFGLKAQALAPTENTLLQIEWRTAHSGFAEVPENPKTYLGIRVEKTFTTSRGVKKLSGAVVENYSITLQNGRPLTPVKIENLTTLNKAEVTVLNGLANSRDLSPTENFVDITPDAPVASGRAYVRYLAKKDSREEPILVGYQSASGHVQVARSSTANVAGEAASKLVKFLRELSDFSQARKKLGSNLTAEEE